MPSIFEKRLDEIPKDILQELEGLLTNPVTGQTMHPNLFYHLYSAIGSRAGEEIPAIKIFWEFIKWTIKELARYQNIELERLRIELPSFILKNDQLHKICPLCGNPR